MQRKFKLLVDLKTITKSLFGQQMFKQFWLLLSLWKWAETIKSKEWWWFIDICRELQIRCKRNRWLRAV